MAVKATLLIQAGNSEDRASYDKTTRLKNHDTPTEFVCGRMPPRACNRTRGFSAPNHKSTAISSGATVLRAVVERRRTCDRDTTLRTPQPPKTERATPAEPAILMNPFSGGERFQSLFFIPPANKGSADEGIARVRWNLRLSQIAHPTNKGLLEQPRSGGGRDE